jgi:hypothetical protein
MQQKIEEQEHELIKLREDNRQLVEAIDTLSTRAETLRKGSDANEAQDK